MIAALLDHLWQSTLFCGVVWLITLAMRNNSAAVRHWLWLTASLKFLIPFAALYWIGALAGLPAPVGAQPALFELAVEAATPIMTPTTSLNFVASGSGAELGTVLVVLWLAGAVIVVTRWLVSLYAASSLVRAARPAPGAPLETRVTDADVEPAVAGSFNPVVLLPVALLGRLSDSQMNAVLEHEHEHIRRYDNLKANIHRLVESLFWFHPAVWWIGRQMIEERELACDEAVLENGHDSAEYAAGILEVCRHCVDRPRVSLPASASALSGNLADRIRRILAGARPASIGLVKVGALLLGTVAFAGVPMFSGATGDAIRRHSQLMKDIDTLASADITLSPATGSKRTVIVSGREVLIQNSSLREMVAIAYGVERWEVTGGPWLDSPRYDVRALSTVAVSDSVSFDPNALRGVVTKLLAARFDLEIHVNRRCQAPCGKPDLAAIRGT